MNKVKLIKNLLISTPIIATPLLANSCSQKVAFTKINDNATHGPNYWINALAKTLKTQLDSISSEVASAATKNNTLDITEQINTARANAKKDVSTQADLIDEITLTFNGTGNLKVEKNINNKDILTVYPSYINSNSKSQQMLTTTLSLTVDSLKSSKKITNTYNIAKSFKSYTTSLTNQVVNTIYPSNDDNKVYVGTRGGISIGTKSDNNYTYKNYTEGLGSQYVTSIYASNDGSTIYIGTYASTDDNGGLTIGTRTSGDEEYKFTNYQTDAGLGSNTVLSVDATSDGNTIYAGTEGGVSIGTKSNDTYTFKNYPMAENQIAVLSVHPINNGNTIYAGTTAGVYIGTKQEGGAYTFKYFNLNNQIIKSVYASSDGNVIYGATKNDGLWIWTKNGDTYKSAQFTTEQGLANNEVNSIQPVNNGNIIYAGTYGGGISVMTKNNSTYNIKNFTGGLKSNNVYSTIASSDGNSLYVGTEKGFAIARANWFTSSNLNRFTNNYQAIALNNKNYT